MKKLLLSAAMTAATFSAFSADQFYVIMKDGSVESYPTDKVDSISFNDPQIAKIMGFNELAAKILKLEEEIAALKANSGIVSDSNSSEFRFFTLNDKEAQITGVNKGTSNLVIPEKVYLNGKAYTVTSIGEEAFVSLPGLKTVELPSSLKTIGIEAFAGCENLTSINIPSGVTRIEQYAFSDCFSLADIDLPSGITEIEKGVFDGCKNLASVTIPESITSIGSSAFYDCRSLTSINIPDGVTSIGEAAFSGCIGLSNIEIPSSVTEIDGQAFEDCENLDVVIDNSEYNVEVGSYAFDGCKSVTWLKGAAETSTPYKNVVKGGVYTASNASLGENITFRVTDVSGSANTKDQVVTFTIDGFDGQFTLSDAGASYLVALGGGSYVPVAHSTLKAENLFENVILFLTLNYKQTSDDYELASGTFSNVCKEYGATETLISVKK